MKFYDKILKFVCTYCSEASYELNSTVDVLVTYRTSFEKTANATSILTESC